MRHMLKAFLRRVIELFTGSADADTLGKALPVHYRYTSQVGDSSAKLWNRFAFSTDGINCPDAALAISPLPQHHGVPERCSLFYVRKGNVICFNVESRLKLSHLDNDYVADNCPACLWGSILVQCGMLARLLI